MWGDLIGWRLEVWEVKGFTQHRTKEIEVYGILWTGKHEREICHESVMGGCSWRGKVRKYGNVRNFPFLVPVSRYK